MSEYKMRLSVEGSVLTLFCDDKPMRRWECGSPQQALDIASRTAAFSAEEAARKGYDPRVAFSKSAES